jgi:hypothetical protein
LRKDERALAVLVRSAGVAAHVALALEHDALVDHEARARDVADEAGGCPDLETLAGDDVAGDAAVDDNRAAGDLRVHHGTLADRERVLRDDLALDAALDAGRTLERQLADDARPLAEEAARAAAVVTDGPGLVAVVHLPLHGRDSSGRSGTVEPAGA